MPKSIAEKTSQLSVRVPDDEMERIDSIRESMEAATSIKPQRSDVVRMVLGLGIDEYLRREESKGDGASRKADGAGKKAAGAGKKKAPEKKAVA